MQEHHTARDVFLTELLVEDELDCLVRPVTVCPQSELDQHTEGDVFVCDHQYHTGCAVRLHSANTIRCSVLLGDLQG